MRVLVIEDQPRQALTLRQGLAAAGFEVDNSIDSANAWARTQTTSYDLILLSLLLPDNDGFNLLRDLRRDSVTVPILAVIGSGSVAERIRCLELGADGYLNRPIHMAELVARVRALVRRVCYVGDSVIRVHDLEIDTLAHAVKRAGLPIRLTRREYTLLEFLARNRGKVCSRSLICEHMYEDQQECTSNVVDVFIRYLRGKIDRGFDKALVLTRWGQGYMLRDEEAVQTGRGA